MTKQWENAAKRLFALLDNRYPSDYIRRIAVALGGRIIFVAVEEIDWIGAEDNYARLHAGRNVYEVREMLQVLMEKLDPGEYIAIDQIHESTTNPRQTFEPSKLEELAESIRQHGLIQPITVRPNSDGFEIVAGARRLRAAQLAELFSLPCRVVELDDAAAMEWQLIELSIVGKSFLCIHAARYVVYM